MPQAVEDDFLQAILLYKSIECCPDFFTFHWSSVLIADHHNKIERYRNTHLGYKLGFLIFDESPAYVETKGKLNVVPRYGDIIGPCRVYHAPYDKRFIDVILKTEVDFVLWMTPYKWFPGNARFAFKSVYLLDVNKAKKKPIKSLTEYNYDTIICLESK